jgi:hypothetical protein
MSAHRLTRRRSVAGVAAAVGALALLAACGTAGTTSTAQSTRRSGGAPGVAGAPGVDRVPAVDPLPTPRTMFHSGVCLATLRRAAAKGSAAAAPTRSTAPTASTASTDPTAHALVTVDADPTGVVGIWLPGLDTRPCHWSLATEGAAVAKRLAGDIRSAPPFPSGRVSCPFDDKSRVDLYFRYPGDRGMEHVTVGLRGCVEISAPGAQPRRGSPALLRDLGRLSPRPVHLVLPRK